MRTPLTHLRLHFKAPIHTMPQLSPIFSKIDSLKPAFLSRLEKAIAIKSVSGDESLRPEVVKMAHFLKDELTLLGAYDIQLKELGKQPPPVENPDLLLPPVVLARVGLDPKKKTVLVYGHYDVQPADITDGWDTEPFQMVVDEENDKILGRGLTDDKGPVIGWLNVLQAHKELGLELPVNLICCFEGMEESGSLGLDQLIADLKNTYFKGVDAVCILDNYWLGTKKPVLTYGLRGVSYYQITVSGPGADLHSGMFGGVIHEPMTDLVTLMGSLVDSKGKILIPGVNEMVAPLSEKEEELYHLIDYELSDLNQASGSDTGIFDNKKDVLMHRWRYPSLSLHGIEGAFSGAGAKTVIPAKVVGKFSIRTVPDMDPRKLDEYVFAHVKKVFSEIDTKNKMHVELVHDGDYWVSDPFNASFTAAAKATELVWGVKPDLTREGGLIPISLTFEKELNTLVLLLPMGRGDDGAHSVNEKMNISNYLEGVKTLSGYLHFYAES